MEERPRRETEGVVVHPTPDTDPPADPWVPVLSGTGESRGRGVPWGEVGSGRVVVPLSTGPFSGRSSGAAVSEGEGRVGKGVSLGGDTLGS